MFSTISHRISVPDILLKTSQHPRQTGTRHVLIQMAFTHHFPSTQNFRRKSATLFEWLLDGRGSRGEGFCERFPLEATERDREGDKPGREGGEEGRDVAI